MRNRVLIAGGGPAGLCLAAYLTAENIPVCIFEAEPCLPKNLRASTFHPPTLDFLEPFGASKILIDEVYDLFIDLGADDNQIEFPVIYNFPSGHGLKNISIPLGILAEINTDTQVFRLLESPLKN